jgi:hypothetical protein
MPDYSLGKIYKIVCNNTGLIYIGSTCEPTLARRLANHKRHLNHWKTGKGHYMTSYKILENNNYDIVLLENHPCDSKDDLHKRERYHIESIDCVNKIIVGRTKQEYEKDNADYIKEYQKKYGPKYREDNKEILSQKKKLYREKNKEKMIEKDKIRYEINKDKLLEKFQCICGKIISNCSKLRHQKCKHHQDFLNSQQEI